MDNIIIKIENLKIKNINLKKCIKCKKNKNFLIKKECFICYNNKKKLKLFFKK
jgi:hypothetical protein